MPPPPSLLLSHHMDEKTAFVTVEDQYHLAKRMF
ncbi:hypothetical protein CSUI_005397 [Cystoisospora suis]|uniref:Uncharacterized protein n=1 Tax=Cystoisospora suis TaxID=483139 RepID=A0A2C6KY44_9APIC|nr:hypothetical protein CSUI_005397 [Cystoisospora suis]